MDNLELLGEAVNRLKDQYLPLIKSRQTFLLTLTGIAGYLCQRPFPLDWMRFIGLVGSLLVTISGCTILNMVLDRDIDRKMTRTRHRPSAAEQFDARQAAFWGGALIALGLLWALALSTLYCLLALIGCSLNVLVYTLWLKRRSAWSILVGGLSGGIPILAGRVLVVTRIDVAGLLLGLVIVFWIPSHNLTLDMLYSADYINAGIPTFINVYGLAVTRAAVAFSSILTAILMVAAAGCLNLPLAVLVIFSAGGLGWIGLAFYTWVHSSQDAVNLLYKCSSFYMLISMLLLSLATLR